MYSIVYTEEAKTHIAFLRRNEPAAFKKVTQLLLDRFIASRPQQPPLTEQEIMDEVNAVRYGM